MKKIPTLMLSSLLAVAGTVGWTQTASAMGSKPRASRPATADARNPNAATPAVPATPATPANPETGSAATPATSATPAQPSAMSARSRSEGDVNAGTQESTADLRNRSGTSTGTGRDADTQASARAGVHAQDEHNGPGGKSR